MVALGRPGVGEDLLAASGFVDVERVDIPFAWEFADPAAYARALASTGPAFEAILTVGEETFLRHATELAEQRVRDGLPLRAVIAVVGFLARKPNVADTARHHGAAVGTEEPAVPDAGFLAAPEPSPEAQALYDDDLEELGFVMNVSKLWAHQPVEIDALFDLMGKAIRPASLTFRQRGILVTACASALGDAYCSLAWGKKLAADAGADLASSVLRGDDELLDDSERALARWARQVARDPNGTTMSDVSMLRDAGLGDTEIFAITFFVALRLAFSTVNDALGARPDRALADITPDAVRDAITFGRPIGHGDT